MIKLVENFREFMALASINQGPDGWTIYSANPKSDTISDTESFISNYLDWLEKRLDELVEAGEISDVNKFDTLLNARYSLDGASSSEIIEWLSKYHGKDQTERIILKFQ
jgi:hypothetical protein